MIKAIQTVYNGYRFRSRLEARWAVFFDTLQIKYEYEKEGFDIDGILYLPDFYLPDYSCWIEIKPDSFVPGSCQKINAFAEATEDTFIVIRGIPKDDDGEGYEWEKTERYNIEILSYKGDPFPDYEYCGVGQSCYTWDDIWDDIDIDETITSEEISNISFTEKELLIQKRFFFDNYFYFVGHDGWVFSLARKSVPELCLSKEECGDYGLIDDDIYDDNITDNGEKKVTKYGLSNSYNAAMQARF